MTANICDKHYYKYVADIADFSKKQNKKTCEVDTIFFNLYMKTLRQEGEDK
jgi:hypothetical protein